MKDYQYYLEKNGQYGVVEKVNYPLVVVSGLDHVKADEVVISEDGDRGVVFGISEQSVEILLLSSQPVKVGSQFARTEEHISVPVGDSQLGWVLSPLGDPIFGEGSYKVPKDSRSLQVKVQGIATRTRIKERFVTGVSIVDMIIPLGKGQKELIVGDRKSGKTSFVLNTIKKQVQDGTIVIYAVIGRKKNDIKQLYEHCVREKINKRVIIVASSSDSSPSLIYLTPFSAMTMAEYFKDQGHNVLVILDDLSTHAKFYREISLIAQRFPGRESYPGDIFYKHAQLMERSGNFIFDKTKEVSITCLPIVETVEGDLSSYISTNIMGMTDGHIFFDSNAFYNGLRPAINVGLSVTRVGKQTQSSLQREINRELTAFLAEYDKLQNYSHFGAELSKKVQKTLLRGDLLYAFFQQSYTESIPTEIQIILFGMIWASLIESKDLLLATRQRFLAEYQKNTYKPLYEKLLVAPSLYEFLTQISLYKDQLLATQTTVAS